MASNGGKESQVSRSYQLEMFEASLSRNTIVVMDTGTGKTHVATLRIMHYLEYGHDRKLVWFLAPTVTLCTQQHAVLRSSLPSVSTRMITGSDNVERWSSQAIWDGILGSHQIVVSTHAILSDALFHGFMTMERLGLLIFDEAHHCVNEHSANKIMRDHYHAQLRRGAAVPDVLGLTASPVMRSKVDVESLRTIEANLNSISRTPRLHREDLRRFVHLPQLTQHTYAAGHGPGSSAAFLELGRILRDIDVSQDPYVLKLIAHAAPGELIEKVVTSRDTYCQKELKKFWGRANHVALQLGMWAVEAFILLAADRLAEAASNRHDMMIGWDREETQYLSELLRPICPHRLSHMSAVGEVSPKVEALFIVLSELKDTHLCGIIFVEQRATAIMLSHLLAQHQSTHHLTCGTFVGTSSSANRRVAIGDLVDLSRQGQALESFRTGRCDIIIATSVLEEGIDISSCNLVVCFDRPSNLKSFIQRRGRAREAQSTFVMMLAYGDQVTKKTNWQELEAQMLKTYQDDRREVEVDLLTEAYQECDERRFKVDTTGAVLTPEIAIQHLNHFCNVLPQSDYSDNRPLYQFLDDSSTGLIRAEVNLPNVVHPSVRRITGRCQWHTERQARKDAAFEAYIALYRAGLVNDNLLPMPTGVGERLGELVETIPSRVPAAGPLDPWFELAKEWTEMADIALYPTLISIHRPAPQHDIQMFLLAPKHLGKIPSCEMFWTATEVYPVTFVSGTPLDGNMIDSVQEANRLILQSVHFQKLLHNRTDFVTYLAPCIDIDALTQWIAANGGMSTAASIRRDCESRNRIVRSSVLHWTPHFFRSWLGVDLLEAASLPRRRNFLRQYESQHSIVADASCSAPGAKYQTVSVKDTYLDDLSEEATVFSVLIPSLMHHIKRSLIASDICKSVLTQVDFRNQSLVLEALSAPSANETVNYQRLELIGDSALKFLVVTQLFTNQTKWHEGYLSQAKDLMVANSRLTRSALDKGIDRYVIVDPFSRRRWHPVYIGELLASEPRTERMMSAKVLADVVEALIGAAFVDGGLWQAAICAHTFLNEIDPVSTYGKLQQGGDFLRSNVMECPPQHIVELQDLLGHKFANFGVLLEAMTHPSFTGDTLSSSYQRLEFLGDGVLDMIVVQRLALYEGHRLSHVRMHLIKSALVNANFLAFLGLNLSIQQKTVDVRLGVGLTEAGLTTSSRTIRLCEFMRYLHVEITTARQRCLNMFDRLSQEIAQSLQYGKKYPWDLLCQLNAPKFMSDIVESLFGAIFIDSRGDLQFCEAFARHIGIMGYLERIVEEGLDILHPKSALGELATGRGKVKYCIKREELPLVGFQCTVTVGEVSYGEAREGLSRDEVTTRAAAAAVSALKKMP